MTKIKRCILAAILLLALLLLTACGGPESTYKSAQDLLSKGKYTEAAEKFESLGSYEDATTLTMYCKACALCESGNYETGIKALKQMGDYKDCAYRITYYNARAYEDEAETDNWEYMLEAKAIYNTIPLFLDSSDRITALDARVEAAKEAQYNAAVEAGESGDYATARWDLQALAWVQYKDSDKRIAYYGIRQEADKLAETTDQDALIAVAADYTEMGEYLDCAERAAALITRADGIVAARYAEVAAFVEEGKYAEAIAILDAFGTYGKEQLNANYYAIGEKYREDNQWSAASAAYKKAGEYSDAANRISYCGLRKEEDQLADTTDENAVAALATRYTDLGDCLDCAERATALNARVTAILDDKYDAAVALMSEGKYNEAVNAFSAIKTPRDSETQIAACETADLDIRYDAAIALMNEEKYAEAYKLFDSLNGYKDSEEMAESMPVFKPGTGMSEGTNAPRLAAKAGNGADPAKIITHRVVYDNTKTIENYTRPSKDLLNMPAAENYITLPYGVMTFRGNAFRQNASVGNVGEGISGMQIKWTAEAASIKGASKTYYGIGWTGQPAIVKWSREVRGFTNIVEEKRNTSFLKEVIVAGMDGNIYFLDLADGEPTRDVVKLGYPMQGSVSIHPLGYPVMTVGQYARKMKTGTGDIGLRFYNLLTQEQIFMIDGLDGELKRPYNEVGSFETAALIDPTSDTLVTAGTNGLLYVTKLNTEFDYNAGSIKIDPTSIVMKSKNSKQRHARTAVESSIAMYQNYAFYADMEGILRCVNTDTMEVVWAVHTEDAVEAAISLDLDEDGKLWLYTANTLQNRNKGACMIRCYDAATGVKKWQKDIGVMKYTKGALKDAVPGAMASAVIGEKDIDGLVIYTVSCLTSEPGVTLEGEGEGKASGAIIALNKKDGSVAWARRLDDYSHSSPVAVYSESGESWIIQASNSGMLYLLRGTTGEVVNTLQVEGQITASPAVYNDTLVIGTGDKDTPRIYGVLLK